MVLGFPFLGVVSRLTTRPSAALPPGRFNVLLVLDALEALPFITHVAENAQQDQQENRRNCNRNVDVEHLDFVGQHVRTGCRFALPHVDNVCIIVGLRRIWESDRAGADAGGARGRVDVRKRESRPGWRAREHYLAFVAEESVTRFDVHGNQTLFSIERSKSLYSITEIRPPKSDDLEIR